MSKKTSQRQAQIVLQSVREEFPLYLGTEGEGPEISTEYHESGPVIIWEGGPEEWSIVFSGSEPARALYRSGIFVEPVNHVVLGLYPA